MAIERARSKHPLKCFCRRKPLLAMYGVDQHGKLYIHIRIYKSHRVFGEILVTEGRTRILCRECLRWHTVTINQPGIATLEETDPPMEVSEPDSRVLANPTRQL
jgi:hypothetical protein